MIIMIFVDTTDVTSGTAYPSGAPEPPPPVAVGFVLLNVVFCVMVSRSLFVLL